VTAEDFDRFVREHERMVHALAFSYVKDEHAADDVMQEAFLRAYRSVDGMRDPTKVKTWLYTLTRNAAIDHLRSRKHRAVSIEEHEVDVAAPQAEERPELLDKVMKIVDDLREDYRQIILMRYVDKMAYTAIAEVLGMTVGAVGEKLHRVRALIAERL
jgi:RNA polymerase sigma-70 factor (ECF subfamily)